MPLHPKQFAVNDAWLVVRATRDPVLVAGEPQHVYIVQDAASMYIVGNALAPVGMKSPSAETAALVLAQAWQIKRQWPKTLLIPGRKSKDNGFAEAAAMNGVPVEFVAAGELALYIDDIQSSYKEFLSRGRHDDSQP